MKYIKERDELFEAIKKSNINDEDVSEYLYLYEDAFKKVSYKITPIGVKLNLDGLVLLIKSFKNKFTHDMAIATIKKHNVKKYVDELKKFGMILHTNDMDFDVRSALFGLNANFYSNKSSENHTFDINFRPTNIIIQNALIDIKEYDLRISSADIKWEINSHKDFVEAVKNIRFETYVVDKLTDIIGHDGRYDFRKELSPGNIEAILHYKDKFLLSRFKELIMTKIEREDYSYVKYLKQFVSKEDWNEKYKHLSRSRNLFK